MVYSVSVDACERTQRSWITNTTRTVDVTPTERHTHRVKVKVVEVRRVKLVRTSACQYGNAGSLVVLSRSLCCSMSIGQRSVFVHGV